MSSWLRRLWNRLRGHREGSHDYAADRELADSSSTPGPAPVARLESTARRPSQKRRSSASTRRSIEPTATQFDGQVSAEPADVVLGLDFGTAATKVVVRTPYIAGGRCVAVAFRRDSRPLGRYLLPTLVHEDVDHRFTLAAVPGASASSGLKIDLMRDPASREARIGATAFLTLAMQEARCWFLRTQAEAYRRYRLRWEVNLGVPSAGYDDQALREAFRTVAVAAWRGSVQRPAITRHDLEEELSRPSSTTSDSDTPIEVIPEVAAAVNAYARSPQRDQGLHLMIDVGATTFDVCGFNLHQRDGEDCYPLFTALVEALGAQILHERRLTAAGSEASQKLRHLAACDPLAPIPDSPAEYSRSNRTLRALRKADETHAQECRSKVMAVLMELKTRRDPHSPRWRQGLPVFLGGGGHNIRPFRDALDAANNLLTKHTHAHGLVVKSIPKPDNLESEISHGEFHRLSVAYGLSYPRLDIGEVIRPSDIADVPSRDIEERGEPVTKDQV